MLAPRLHFSLARSARREIERARASPGGTRAAVRDMLTTIGPGPSRAPSGDTRGPQALEHVSPGRLALEQRARLLPTIPARREPAHWWQAVTPRQMALALAIATGLILTG